MSFTDILADVRNGKPIIILDDETREHEGDIFVAAEHSTPEIINFMATHARGLICMPIIKQRANELDLSPMVQEEKNTERERCKFTIPIDAKEGTTTGISAYDRSSTITKVLDKSAKPEDFRRPGHLFPLIAEDGGVFSRRGHTEAAVDLARLAHLKPAGVICEILSDDGTMAKGAQLEQFAQRHKLNTITVEQIKQEKMMREPPIKKEIDVSLPTAYGQFRLFAYKNQLSGQEELALVKGDIANKQNILVRIHSECMTGDVFRSLRCDCNEQLNTALHIIGREKAGIVIYLRHEGRGIGLMNKLHAYKLQDGGLDTVESNKQLGFPADARDYWPAAVILRSFNIKSVRLLTNNPAKKNAIEKYGINVTEVVHLETMPTHHNAKYLQTKQEKLGHLIDIKKKLVFI